MKKIAILILIAITAVLGAVLHAKFVDGQQLGASNNVSYTPDLYPITDSQYYVGTTTKAYKAGTFDELCLGGSCQSSWSAGSYPDYLSQVGDVSTTTLATGYVLKWSGTEWESVATSTLNITATGDGTFSTTSAIYFVNASTTIPKTYTANTFTGLQTFGNSSTTNTSVSGHTVLNTLTTTGQLIFGNASSTQLTVSGKSWLGNASSSGSITATNFYGALVGNAQTASALFADGADCSAGQFPLGVNASGAVVNCTDAWTEAENTSAGYLNTAGVNAYIHGSSTIPKTYTANTFTGLQTIGNASTTFLSVGTNSWLGTIKSGIWNGTSITDAYIDDTITASNYILTSAFNGLFDTRLGATTSLPQVTTLANLATVGTAGATTTVAGKLKATEAFTLGTDYITDITGTGLSITNGVLNATASGGSTEPVHWIASTTGATYSTSTVWAPSLNATSSTSTLNGLYITGNYLRSSSLASADCDVMARGDGTVYCGTNGAGGGSISGWATTTSSVAGQLNLYTTNTTDILTIGSNSTTTAEFFVDPNTVTMQMNGSNGTSSMVMGSALNQWVLGTSNSDKSFRIASSTGQLDGIGAHLTIQKNGYVGIGTTTPYSKLTVSAGEGSGGSVVDRGWASTWGTLLSIIGNVVGGVTMTVENQNSGAASFAGIMFGNDVSTLDTTAWIYINSSTTNDPAYPLDSPSGMTILNQMGSVMTSARDSIQFATGQGTSQGRIRLTLDWLGNLFMQMPRNAASDAPIVTTEISEPWGINVITTANYMSTYSDDYTNLVQCGTAAASTLQLRATAGFGAGATANTYLGTTAQAITLTSLYGVGVVGRGCMTFSGFHFIAYASTSPSFFAIKTASSTATRPFSVATSWATTTVSGFTLPNTSFLVGAVQATSSTGVTNDVYIATSTVSIARFRYSTSTNTLTYINQYNFSGTNILINNTRVNNNGMYIGFSAAPFTRKYTLDGVAVPNINNYGSAVPSTTGPDMFAMPYSLYGLYGSGTTYLTKLVGY